MEFADDDLFEAVNEDGSPVTTAQLVAEAIEALKADHGPGSHPVAFEHEQGVAQTVWTIEHLLGYDPSGIMVHDASGVTVEGFSVQYMEPGAVVRLGFDIPFAGVARLT